MPIAKDVRTDIGREKAMKLISLDVLEERVNRGAQLLDINRPGWAREIDVDSIQIGCEEHSITGQLFGPKLDDQLAAVGITVDADRPWTASEALAEAGFYVLMSDIVVIPEEIRARMRAIAVDIGAIVGRDMSDVIGAPEMLPVPRDRDIASQEAHAIEYLWGQAVRSRR